jgi:hypothetical protein
MRAVFRQTKERDQWIPIAMALFFMWKSVRELTAVNPDRWSTIASLAMFAVMVRLAMRARRD